MKERGEPRRRQPAEHGQDHADAKTVNAVGSSAESSATSAGAVLGPIPIGSAIDLPQQDLAKPITAYLFTCGIASIIQAVGFWKIGVGLPRARA